MTLISILLWSLSGIVYIVNKWQVEYLQVLVWVRNHRKLVYVVVVIGSS